jgi:hypothetical protein
VSEDFYHDDPIEEISKKSLRSKFLSTGVVIVGSIFFLQSTLAGNISLNSNRGIEFGQSVSQAVACSGSTDLTLTPRSSFANGSGASGAHYLNSIIVSNIPNSCYGVDFTIQAFGNSSSTPLALFNSTSTKAVVYDNNGAFSPGVGSSGMNITSGTGAFTVTFNTPVAQSSTVFKLTIQSGLNTPFVYQVGDRGPGDGFIYYVNQSGFSCGALHTTAGSPTGGKCKYLEVAASDWNTGSDPTKAWAVSAYQSADISAIANDVDAYGYLDALGVGLGYKNSIAIVNQNGAYNQSSNDYAAGAARAYAGGSQNDWYLPSTAELNLLCQWARGVTPSVTTACTGGSINSSTYGASSAGFGGSNFYWSSSEKSAQWAWDQGFNGQIPTYDLKSYAGLIFVRPVRAF